MTIQDYIEERVRLYGENQRERVIGIFNQYQQHLETDLFKEKSTGNIYRYHPTNCIMQQVTTDELLLMVIEIMTKFTAPDNYRRAVEDFLNANPPRE